MYHSITFINSSNEEMNTWDDWYLIPSSRPVFNPPEVKTQYVDLPGGNGQIDLTESLTGYPVYENRTGSIEFYVENGHESWDVLYSKIANFLHGRTLTAYLEDDPGFVYEGRFDINEWKSDKWWSVITINYNVYPYKKERFSSLENWLWDPFDFETGIIREYKDLSVNGSLSLEIIATNEPISPVITVTKEPVAGGSTLTVSVSGHSYELQNGTNYLPDLVIKDKNVTLTFSGQATISVNYRGGSL